MSCELCHQVGGKLLWQDECCRVVLVDDADYPGYCRVIWNAHVKEMTDLTSTEREHLMQMVFATESCLRDILQPQKFNLASLGNLTPHLHWHVIPRFTHDAHFPNAIWGQRVRDAASTSPPGGFVEELRVALAKNN